MIAITAALVAVGGVYAYVRRVGLRLDDEEVVGVAPVPAGAAGGLVYACATLLPTMLTGRANRLLGLRFAAGTFGFAASSALGLVAAESILDIERDDDRYAPRLLTWRENE